MVEDSSEAPLYHSRELRQDEQPFSTLPINLLDAGLRSCHFRSGVGVTSHSRFSKHLYEKANLSLVSFSFE